MTRSYRPVRATPGQAGQAARAGSDGFQRKFDAGIMPMKEVMTRYTTVVHAPTGSVRETARRLGVDRSQIAGRLDEELLAQLVAEGEGEK